ncbi:MAG: hypothetical protein WAV72_14275 [Bradyrhizobium sp.]
MSPADIKGQKARVETRINGLLKTLTLAAVLSAVTLHCQQVAAQSKDAVSSQGRF